MAEVLTDPVYDGEDFCAECNGYGCMSRGSRGGDEVALRGRPCEHCKGTGREPDRIVYPEPSDTCCTCGLAFGAERADGSKVTEAQRDDRWICSRCAPCTDECSCDSEEAHDRAEEESLRDFLRNPGPPPAHFTAEDTERGMRGIEAARRERGIK